MSSLTSIAAIVDALTSSDNVIRGQAETAYKQAQQSPDEVRGNGGGGGADNSKCASHIEFILTYPPSPSPPPPLRSSPHSAVLLS